MAAGVQNSGLLILFLSEGVLERPFVQFELEEALRGKKTVLLVHEQAPRHNPFVVAKEVKAAPAWIQELMEHWSNGFMQWIESSMY